MTLTAGPVNRSAYPDDVPGAGEVYLPLDGAVISPEEELDELRAATVAFKTVVDTIEPIVPADRQTRMSYEEVDAAPYGTAEWRPGRVFKYSSRDPYQEANPELTAATTAWIEATMRVTGRLKDHNATDPQLAYLNGKRNGGGRTMTEATRIIAGVDPVLGAWVTSLPRAENLRVVANPWPGSATTVEDKTLGFINLPSSPALQAMAGGSKDGRAVRERGAWESDIVAEIDPATLPDGELVITSLGTGTGEPAADSGIGLAERYRARGGALRVVVNGVDIKESSLRVATHIAEEKARTLRGGEELTFVPHLAALHKPAELARIVRSTNAKVYEAIGLTEYVASENATDPVERLIYEMMQRVGGGSVEDFYRAVYENMPEGSIFITGNMTSTSPQGDFVEDGLGWPGIIRRSTEECLAIPRNAGIPGEAIDLFVPDTENSAASYNLLVIRKPYTSSHNRWLELNAQQSTSALGRHALYLAA